ncbi:hypothetical protein J4230_04600 [Candidatus Woesearchaeota archaeon]|nr:hypothetical protein [Candidatus Woesearchaeota archaeon]
MKKLRMYNLEDVIRAYDFVLIDSSFFSYPDRSTSLAPPYLPNILNIQEDVIRRVLQTWSMRCNLLRRRNTRYVCVHLTSPIKEELEYFSKSLYDCAGIRGVRAEKIAIIKGLAGTIKVLTSSLPSYNAKPDFDMVIEGKTSLADTSLVAALFYYISENIKKKGTIITKDSDIVKLLRSNVKLLNRQRREDISKRAGIYWCNYFDDKLEKIYI